MHTEMPSAVSALRPHVENAVVGSFLTRSQTHITQEGRATIGRANPLGTSYVASSIRFVVRCAADADVHADYLAPQRLIVDEAITHGYTVAVFTDYGIAYVPPRKREPTWLEALDTFVEYMFGWGVVTL